MSASSRSLLRAWVASVLLALSGGAPAEPVDSLPPLFQTDFQATSPSPPPAWLLLNGDWRVEGKGQRVLRQVMAPLYQEAFALINWYAPTVLARFRAPASADTWGVGVVAHARADRYYAAAVVGDDLQVLKRQQGWVTSLAKQPLKLTPGKWYWLQLGMGATEAALRVTAACWPEGGDEPEALTATDKQDVLPAGTVGLWCANADAAFDRFELRCGSASAQPCFRDGFSAPSVTGLPAHWDSARGRWLLDRVDDRSVLRHPLGGQEVSFNQNALCLLRPRNYTVTARLRRDSDSRVWGGGVVAHSRGAWPHYRLRCIGTKLYLTKRLDADTAENLAELQADLKPNVWYTFTLTVRSLSDGVQLWGQVRAEASSAESWRLQAFDSVQPLAGGAPGLWAFGAPLSFDDFRVTLAQ